MAIFGNPGGSDPSYNKQCPYCSRNFTTSDSKKVYCSPSCKNCSSSSRRMKAKEERKETLRKIRENSENTH